MDLALFILILFAIAAPPLLLLASKNRWQFSLQSLLLLFVPLCILFAIAALSREFLAVWLNRTPWSVLLPYVPFMALELAWPFLISWIIASLILGQYRVRNEKRRSEDLRLRRRRRLRIALREPDRFAFYPLLVAVIYLVLHKCLVTSVWVWLVLTKGSLTDVNSIGLSIAFFNSALNAMFLVYVSTLSIAHFSSQHWKWTVLDAPHVLVLLMLIAKQYAMTYYVY